MSLTVKELLLNHSRGISSLVENTEGQYFDTEIPRFDDITDAIEHKANLKAQQLELEQQIKEEQALASKTKKDAAKQAKIDKKQQLEELKKEFPEEKPTEEGKNL